jgi:glycosyltransferase involved in cell wall biosynthesis
MVDCYIALTEFSRDKFVAAGLPADKIVVKPNFVDPDPGEREQLGTYALFAGRLALEKGALTLLQAWEQLPERCALHIVGDGPEREGLEAQARQRHLTAITFRGRLSREETIAEVKGARFLIMPSLWFEGFPLSIAEAFACGTPVICSRLGGMADIVDDHRTGLHFTAGDVEDMVQKLNWALTHPCELSEMGRAARREYERHFTPQKNYSRVMEIYRRVLRERVVSAPVIVHRDVAPT